MTDYFDQLVAKAGVKERGKKKTTFVKGHKPTPAMAFSAKLNWLNRCLQGTGNILQAESDVRRHPIYKLLSPRDQRHLDTMLRKVVSCQKELQELSEEIAQFNRDKTILE